MFTEKDLVAGETVLEEKKNDVKFLYLGNAGLVHFVSRTNYFKAAGGSYYTIEELNKYFNIEQPKSNTVPLEKKVYDFVPVRCRDNDNELWKSYPSLIAVVPDAEYPYKVLSSSGIFVTFKQCEFLNEQ